jgi:hypothetical protein
MPPGAESSDVIRIASSPRISGAQNSNAPYYIGQL